MGVAGTSANVQLAVFGVAFVVRIIHLLVGDAAPQQDTPDYDEIAANLISGEGFVSRENWFGHEMRSWRAPFYPFFLATVYTLFGFSHLAVQLIQAAIGAATTLLIYRFAGLLYPPMALGVGLLAAVYGPLASVSNEVMTETWFVFWVVMSLLALTRVCAGEGTNLLCLLLGGGAVGMAALTRPVGALIWVAFGVVATWQLGRKGLRYTLSVGFIAGLMVLPWSIRNYYVHGTVVPITTHGGFILARSHAPSPDWKQERGWGIRKQLFESQPSEIERDRQWMKLGWQQIRSEPGRYLRLSVERFLRFWYFLRPDYNFWFMIVLPFFFAGTLRFSRCPRFSLAGVYLAVSLFVFTFVLYGSARFRLPLETIFLLFAGAFVTDLAQRDSRRAVLWVGLVVALNILLWAVETSLRNFVLTVLQAWDLS